jgi:hypothetical protein
MKIDTLENLDIVWAALEAYRAYLIPEGDEMYDKIWNEVCTAMHHIAEDLRCPEFIEEPDHQKDCPAIDGFGCRCGE